MHSLKTSLLFLAFFSVNAVQAFEEASPVAVTKRLRDQTFSDEKEAKKSHSEAGVSGDSLPELMPLEDFLKTPESQLIDFFQKGSPPDSSRSPLNPVEVFKCMQNNPALLQPALVQQAVAQPMPPQPAPLQQVPPQPALMRGIQRMHETIGNVNLLVARALAPTPNPQDALRYANAVVGDTLLPTHWRAEAQQIIDKFTLIP